MKRVEELEMRAVTTWPGLGASSTGRSHPGRLLLTGSRRHEPWRRRRWPRPRNGGCFSWLVLVVIRILRDQHKRRSAAASADRFQRLHCQLRAFLALSNAAQQAAQLSRRALQLEVARDRRTSMRCLRAWWCTEQGVQVAQMAAYSWQQRVHAAACVAISGWASVAAASSRLRPQAAEGWRRQRLVVAFTAWSGATDNA
jgi:hypothetical protein